MVFEKNYGNEIEEEYIGGGENMHGREEGREMSDALENFIQVENTISLYQRFRSYVPANTCSTRCEEVFHGKNCESKKIVNI
jgi:hypothetical protein